MTTDDNFIQRFKDFVSKSENDKVYISISGFTKLLKANNLLDSVTDSKILQSGLYGYFLGKPVYVTRNIPDDKIAICSIISKGSYLKKYHSLTGPAVRYDDGHSEYWIDGIQYSFEEWNRRKELQVFK